MRLVVDSADGGGIKDEDDARMAHGSGGKAGAVPSLLGLLDLAVDVVELDLVLSRSL